MFIVVGAIFKILNIRQDKKIADLLAHQAQDVDAAMAEERLATITNIRKAA
jgi:hypothetical protein